MPLRTKGIDNDRPISGQCKHARTSKRLVRSESATAPELPRVRSALWLLRQGTHAKL